MNGYRRGAYQDITKDLTNEEKHSKAMRNVKSSDWLSEHFGVRFRYNALGDLNTQNIVSSSDSFGITEGVHSVSMHAGSTLAITDPKKQKVLSSYQTICLKTTLVSCSRSRYLQWRWYAQRVLMLLSPKVGKGKAAFIGDSSLVEDSTPKYVREDNGRTRKRMMGLKNKIIVNYLKYYNLVWKTRSYTEFKKKQVLS